MKIKETQLRQIIREEIQKLNESIIRKNDSYKEILELNLFTDMFGDKYYEKISDRFEDYADDKDWMKIEKKYTKIAKQLKRDILKNKNKKLSKEDAEILDDTFYDGSDAYDSIDDSIYFLPDIYDEQIKAIKKLNL